MFNINQPPETSCAYSKTRHFKFTVKFEPPETSCAYSNARHFKCTVKYQPPETSCEYSNTKHFKCTVSYQPPETSCEYSNTRHFKCTVKYQPPETPCIGYRLHHAGTTYGPRTACGPVGLIVRLVTTFLNDICFLKKNCEVERNVLLWLRAACEIFCKQPAMYDRPPAGQACCRERTQLASLSLEGACGEHRMLHVKGT